MSPEGKERKGLSPKGTVPKDMNRRGQSTLEYVVVIAIVAAALITMQGYIKRGMQGRLRTQADEMSGGTLYSPGATTASSTITRNIDESSRSYTEENGQKRNISDSWVNINQTTQRQEGVVSLDEEPQR
jgi:uncharacterized protein (UPF0333 family)